MEIALLPIRAVTNLVGRVTEPKSPDHRNASMVEGGTLTPRYTLAGVATAPVLDDHLAAAGALNRRRLAFAYSAPDGARNAPGGRWMVRRRVGL
jgi:hypothetical protein